MTTRRALRLLAVSSAATIAGLTPALIGYVFFGAHQAFVILSTAWVGLGVVAVLTSVVLLLITLARPPDK